jgi:glutathione S-transferase
MTATLFGVPASHPSLAAELMLRHKGVDYRRVDLVSALHRVLVRALGFPGSTVPALRIERARVQGTRDISQALDALRPNPPLFPPDAARRRAVLEAEAWGDAVFQPVPRRIICAGLKRDRSTIASYLEGARTGIPVAVAERTVAPIVAIAARANEASDENVRRDLAALPDLLDRVDELLRDGTIGGGELNAADFQIAASTALLATMAWNRCWRGAQRSTTHAGWRPAIPAACRRSFRPPGCRPEQQHSRSVRSRPYRAT